jgi:CIC family chloride channel protein
MNEVARRRGLALRASRRWIRSAGYLRRWLVLGVSIGVIGGLGAIVFYNALEFATHVLLTGVGGYAPPTPAGEGAAPMPGALERPWAIPIVTTLGALVSGLLVARFAPEAEGHGTDAAIAAFHHHPRGIRARVPLVKMVASAVTIGSGGSGGREGPSAQIGAGAGSMLARILDLDARDARMCVAVGMAAGIGAIFRAPLGGAILGAELLYREDVESDALVPSFVATIIAYSIFGTVEGFQPIFGAQARFGFSDAAQLGWYAVIGIASGLVGILYIRSFYGATDVFRRWRAPLWFKPAVGGLLVGLIGIAVPGVLGTGYGYVQAGLDRNSLFALPVLLIVALPFLKILATSLSIGSGGSGGIFGPGMVVGGLLGAGIWRVLVPFAPAMPADPAPFAIVAMMALFGSIAHAPLAVMLMVAEMTGNLSMLAPAMVAVGLATFVVGERSIYRSQLATRADSPAHRFRFALPLLAAVPVMDAARQPRVVLRTDEPVADARMRLEEADVPGAPVLDAASRVVGVADAATLADAPPDDPVGRHAVDPEPSLGAEDALDDALGALADHRREWAPVVTDGRLAGVLSVQDVMSAYRIALEGNVRRVRGLRAEGIVLEVDLASGSALGGKRISEVAWPRRAVVVAIERGDALLVPRGDLVLQAGDRLSIFADESARRELDRLVAG